MFLNCPPPHLGQNGYFIFAEIFVYVKYVKKVADIPPPPSPYGNFPVYWQWLQSSVILIEITFFIFFALNSLKVGFYEYWYMRSESLGFNPNYWSYGWVHYRYLYPSQIRYIHMYCTVQSMKWDLQGHHRLHVEVGRQGSYRRYDKFRHIQRS